MCNKIILELKFSSLPFTNNDVDCDGNPDDVIVGLNEETLIILDMPLPPDIKYCYYVSNVAWAFGDGAVDDMQAWLYKNGNSIGNGSTAHF